MDASSITAGKLATARLNVGTGADMVAAGDDARVVAAVRRAPSMAALRALAVPGPTDPLTAALAGYYTPADGGGGQFTWDVANTLADNGGTIIRPSAVASGAAGRWLRVMDDPMRLNLLWFGAKWDNNGSSAFDSLPAFNAAVSSLPAATYSTITSPGAGGSGTMRTGTIYFPDSGVINLGFCFGGTMYASAGVSLIGSAHDGGTLLYMKPGVAPSASSEKFLIFYLASGSTGGMYDAVSNSFFTRVENLFIATGSPAANPGGSGAYIAVANNGVVRNLNVGEIALRGAVVNSTGCVVDGYWSTGPVHRGPSLTFTGSHIVASHLSPEHTNSGPSILGEAYAIDASDGLGDYYPALLLDYASDCIIGEVQCENSPLGVKIRNGIGNWIGSVSCNEVATGVKISADSTNNTIQNVVGVDMTTTVRDVSGSSGYVRNETRTIQRQPYSQNLNAVDAVIKTATVSALEATTLTTGGKTVVPESLSFTSFDGSRHRANLSLFLLDQAVTPATTYLVRVNHGAAVGAVALLTISKPYQGDLVAQTTIISGAGLLVTVTGASRTAAPTYYDGTLGTTVLKPQVDLSIVQDGGSFGGQASISVRPLGAIGPGDVRESVAWTAPTEGRANVLDGTATGTLSATAPALSGTNFIGVARLVAKPATTTSAGKVGDYWLDTINNKVVFYLGDGTTHKWGQDTLTSYVP